MKTRKLITGRRVREAEAPIKWQFESKCPAKWVHVDCESGRVYIAHPDGGWKEPTRAQINAAIESLEQWKPR